MAAVMKSSVQDIGPALVLAIGLVLGLGVLGYFLGHSALAIKAMERTVTVKGLAEQERPADVVIWPLTISTAANELHTLYAKLQADGALVRQFLQNAGIAPRAITSAAPSVVDKLAQQYGGNGEVPFRYAATQVLTVYSEDVDGVRATMAAVADLGKQGVLLSSDNYRGAVQYLFQSLNDIKPAMVEDATENARAVAAKFAQDSASRLGKIKRASQGQFSIQDRDSNTPHIKKIRVVSTVEYYLVD